VIYFLKELKYFCNCLRGAVFSQPYIYIKVVTKYSSLQEFRYRREAKDKQESEV